MTKYIIARLKSKYKNQNLYFVWANHTSPLCLTCGNCDYNLSGKKNNNNYKKKFDIDFTQYYFCSGCRPAGLKGSRPLIKSNNNNMEGTPPLRGVPYPTF